jgi:repressor LexA
MKNLTRRQEEILNLIKSHILDLGFPPTRADISRSLGFKSPNAAEQHLRAIEKKGFIKILSGASRGIVLNDSENDQIPVIGLVAAGGPILAEENIEKTIPRSNNLLSSDIDYYLRVKGDSMVDIGIFEEDLIGVSKSANTKVGSVVVARINNEVTVKTLIEMSQNKVVLRPENRKYDDIIVNPQVEELAIEGSCIALLRETI